MTGRPPKLKLNQRAPHMPPPACAVKLCVLGTPCLPRLHRPSQPPMARSRMHRLAGEAPHRRPPLPLAKTRLYRTSNRRRTLHFLKWWAVATAVVALCAIGVYCVINKLGLPWAH